MTLVDKLGEKIVLNFSSQITKIIWDEQVSTVLIGALVVQCDGSQRKRKSLLVLLYVQNVLL